MKLWLISQDQNNNYGTYDSAVVAAETEEAAKNIVPGGYKFGEAYSLWCSGPEFVKVELIGKASSEITAGVVLASFNAG